MTDRLEVLFEDLRADTVTKIRPPGVAAARHTVRRRRDRRSAVAACAALVVAAGGVTYLHRTLGGDPADAPLAATRDAVGAPFLQDAKVALTTTVAGEVSVTRDADLRPGYYMLRTACAGEGWVTVTVIGAELDGGILALQYGEGPPRSTTPPMPCATSPEPVSVNMDVPGSGGTVRVIVARGGAAPGEAAVTVGLVDQAGLRREAESLVREATDHLQSGFAVASGVFDLPAGDHRLIWSCVGRGRLSVSVGDAATPASRVSGGVSCGTGPATLIDFRSSGGSVAVVVEAEDATPRSAEWVYAFASP